MSLSGFRSRFFLKNQSQKYNSYTTGEIAKWGKTSDVQLNTAPFKVSYPFLVLFSMEKYRTACNIISIYERFHCGSSHVSFRKLQKPLSHILWQVPPKQTISQSKNEQRVLPTNYILVMEVLSRHRLDQSRGGNLQYQKCC